MPLVQYEGVAGLIPLGLAGAIYTQTTDVEGELNGLLISESSYPSSSTS